MDYDMPSDKMLLDIKDRLNKKNVRELWDIAREVGVPSPTDGKSKEQNIKIILDIASCKVVPSPKAKRGAPPKSSEYDEELVADIKKCIEYYTLLKKGTETNKDELGVSDGTSAQVCEGILVKAENNFFICSNGRLTDASDVYVPAHFVNRFHLKEGDFVKGECRRKSPAEFAILLKILSVGGNFSDSAPRREFSSLTPIYPNKRIYVANSGEDIAARMLDLFAPVGYGQRAVISASANSAKSSLIKQIAKGISATEHLSVVFFIVAGSPEEITDIGRTSSRAEVFYTTFDMEQEQHIQKAEFVATYCKSAVERGENVVLIVDGLSKLANSAKRLLSSAICAEEGGSLTVIATVSAEGEYSSEYSAELLSAANMRVVLSDSDVHTPSIDVIKSYTRNSGLLQSEEELKTAEVLRKRYKMAENIQDIIELFKNTENNTEIIKSNG